MCDICSVIYHSDTKHDISVCPVRAALFCSVCQTRGHSTMKCPDKATWAMRVPEFIEQLISPALLRHHRITSQTPILSPNSAPLDCSYISVNGYDKHPIMKVTYTPVLEVPIDTTGQFIRATLASYNLPSSSIKENKRVLEAFGALIGKKVVYLQGKNDVVEKKIKAIKVQKVRKVIKTKKNTQVTETQDTETQDTEVTE